MMPAPRKGGDPGVPQQKVSQNRAGDEGPGSDHPIGTAVCVKTWGFVKSGRKTFRMLKSGWQFGISKVAGTAKPEYGQACCSGT